MATIIILPLDPLVADPTATLELIAFVEAFNFSFDVVMTMGVALLPIVAAMRLVQRT